MVLFDFKNKFDLGGRNVMNLINRIGEELGFALNFVKVGLLLACFLIAIADLL